MILGARTRAGVGAAEITEGERQTADVINVGKVHEADYAKARVRVLIGDEDDENGHLITGWLPMPGGRARGDSEWHPLEVGERVVVLAEAGELQNGVVIPAGLYTDEDPAPGDKAGLWRKRFSDGGSVEYDRATGAFKVNAKTSAELAVGSASIKVEAGQILLSVGGTTLKVSSSGVDVTGSFKAAGGDFKHENHDVGYQHRHINTMSGSGTSGPPQ